MTDPAPRSGWILFVAMLAVGLEMVQVNGYGIFRDELYYLACAQHLDWGYVDHPPLVAALTALVRGTFGSSLLALRIVPALAFGGAVWFTGALAAQLGGRRFAQGLAGLSLAFAPVLLSLCTTLSMNSIDLLVWSMAFFLFARLLRAPDTRTWADLGLILGLGLLNKLSVLFLGLGLFAGLLVGPRRLFETRGPWLCAGIAMLLFAPHVVWQYQHGWPTFQFMANARAHKMVALAPLDFWKEQVLGMGLLSAPIWLAGLVSLLRGSEGRGVFRPLAVAFVIITAAFTFGEGKAYYAAPAFVPLFAAGGCAWERFCAERRWWRALVPAVVVAGGLLALPMARPILPVESYLAYTRALGVGPAASGENHAVAELPQFFADMHGWRELADHVRTVVSSLPVEDQARVCVFAENYGQAGALDFYGPVRAISGHNAYWTWGPRGCDGDLLIVLGGDQAELEARFTHVELAATHDCTRCMPYEDQKPIWIARGLRADLATVWAEIKHYD